MMIGGSLLAVLPKGFFSWPITKDNGKGDKNSLLIDVRSEKEGRKRRRRSSEGSDCVAGSRTPTLVSPARGFSCAGDVSPSEDGNERPRKRVRQQSNLPSVPQYSTPVKEEKTREQKSELLNTVPEDVIAHCLSFLGTTEDRFALQTTCKLFRDVSNSDSMLENVKISGNGETGKNGIILEKDTPATAAAALAPFAQAGNLEALYMLGIVKCYCYQDLKNGILMLKLASQRGFVRSSYTMGIILRDAMPGEAAHYMNLAASTGYLPALQELLPAWEMKERFGEPDADELRRHLDPACLNRLLLRDYVESAELRGLNTSHCWNPLCGKWAYKATNTNNTVRIIQPPPGAYDLEGESEPTVAQVAGTFISNRQIVGMGGSRETPGSDRIPRRPTRQHAPTCRSIKAMAWKQGSAKVDRVSRMKMCSRCCRAKYCSKLCQVYDWRSSQHKMECQFL